MADLMLVDGIKWQDWRDTNGFRHVTPICIQHGIRLTPVLIHYNVYQYGANRDRTRPESESTKLHCAEDTGHEIALSRKYKDETSYVKNKIDSVIFQKMKVLNLDDSAIPVVDEKIKDKDNPYWIRAKVTESKSGTRLIIWAGNREAKNKAQLFVEPEIRKLSFDQNDDHPLEVFTKVEVTFAENFKATISKNIEA